MSELKWINVNERMPIIGDHNADGIKVLFIWDYDIYTGWPIDDVAGGNWETAEFAHELAGVKYWAKFPRIPDNS